MDKMFSMRSSVFTDTVCKKCAAYVWASVYISESVCRCVTGQHMASPACSEILNSSVSKKGTACVRVCV